MPKLKKLLPTIFGTNKDSHKTIHKNESEDSDSFAANVECDKCRLETDALPVDDNEELPISNNNTPTPSTELTESVVRELSDSNINSADATFNNNGYGEVATLNANSALALRTNDSSLAPNTAGALGPATMNTMNVHNAQQQMVMQFSNINQLHFGSVYNFNSNISGIATSNLNKNNKTIEPTTPGGSKGADTPKRLHPRKTTTIVAMMQSREEPNHRILETISTHLGEGWKHIMRELGHSEGQIEQALIDHQMHGGIKEVIYQLLLQWIHDADDNVATLGHITSMLWESNHRDCVQRMKLVYKSDADKGRKSS